MIPEFPIYDAAERLINKGRTVWKDFTLDQIRAKLKAAQDSSENRNLYEFLLWKYSHEPVLIRCNRIYPVVHYHAPDTQIEKPDSILLRKLVKRWRAENELDPIDTSLRALLEKLKKAEEKKLSDDPTFTMVELKTRGLLGFTAQLGTYFQMVDTCEALEWEILNKAAHKLKDNKLETFKEFDRQLPMRSALHAKIGNPVIDGSYRNAALSISTLVAFWDEGDIYLWVRQRSQSVATHPLRFHVIPSALFQPGTAMLEEEFSVIHNTYREYLEEIFDRKDLGKFNFEADFRFFYGDPRLNYLRELIEKGDAKLYLSGAAVSLLNLRPEICTILLVRSKEWYKSHSQASSENWKFSFNDEYTKDMSSIRNREKSVIRVPYKTTDEELMELAYLEPYELTPTGAAAFWLGMDLLRKVLK